MSSQKLQAQRGQRPQMLVSGNIRPQTEVPERDEENVGDDDRTEVGRAEKQPESQGYPAVGPLRPPSRGTDITEMPAMATKVEGPDRSANASPQADTIRTHASDAPLQNVPLSKHKPPRLDLGKLSGTSNIPQGAKSPRSFRSSLIPSRNGRHSMASIQGRQSGREKLPSNASSPHPVKHTKEMVRSPGKNYEYFSGNTVFCLGGRLQNSRDRPINIVSAIFILLPIGLFFGFS
jgi:palmitoyltransferase ZDHHC9/14/18